MIRALNYPRQLAITSRLFVFQKINMYNALNPRLNIFTIWPPSVKKTEVIIVSEMLLTTCQTVWCHKTKKRPQCEEGQSLYFCSLRHGSENAACVTIHHVLYWIMTKLIKCPTDIV